MEKPRRLGRGLEALIQQARTPRYQDAVAEPAEAGARQAADEIPIIEIRPNPFQPRKEFKPEELAELQASLKANGLIQPVTVRPATGNQSGYELVAGERRLRAASALGWTHIAAHVRELSNRDILTLALVENLQRADLNPIEEAEGYRRLADEYSLTQLQIADAVGKDRSTVANMMRVLQLPETVRTLLRDTSLTLGHARALLALGTATEMESLAREIVTKGLSVRETERRTRVRKPTPGPVSGKRTVTQSASAAEVRRIEGMLRKHLQTDVKITVGSDNRGSLVVSFYSSDDMDRLLKLMLGDRWDPDGLS